MDDIEIAHLDELESSHFWYKARKDQLTNWMKFLNCESLNILDLGSASGGNTLHLINLGHNVTSVEYSDIGVRLQHGKGISAIQADARCLPFSDESFDVIICLDVLEHIKEDYKVAAEINRLLTRNGHFLISVPQDPNLWSDHDVSVNHIRRYAKENLDLNQKGRMFKLGGRCELNSKFTLDDYKNTESKYVFKERVISWMDPGIQQQFGSTHILETRLYSWCLSLVDEYLGVLEKNFKLMNQGFDTEHSHFLNIPKDKLLEYEMLNVSCFVSGGNYYKED
ncbi:class I SAM-dependent methyltransferase [bacterium]|nr:class I SAM-dependent methyltransferase [bacterium]